MVNTESYNKATERFIDAGGFIRTNLFLVQATTPYVPVLTNQSDSFIMAVPGTMVVFLFDFILSLIIIDRIIVIIASFGSGRLIKNMNRHVIATKAARKSDSCGG